MGVTLCRRLKNSYKSNTTSPPNLRHAYQLSRTEPPQDDVHVAEGTYLPPHPLTNKP